MLLELFSCFACVNGDRLLEKWTAERIRECLPQIRMSRATVLHKNHWEGNPAMIIDGVG